MCNDTRTYTPAAIAEMERIGLESMVEQLRKLFASRAWQLVRRGYPGYSDLEIIGELARWESLRQELKQSRL